jgi:hypothetical protein
MQDKTEIIKTYLFAICDHKNPWADKDNLLKIWLQEFDYLDEKEEYLINFMTACREVINDSSIHTIPSPYDIRSIIKENLEPKTKNIRKPVRGMSAEFKKVWHEWVKISFKEGQTAEEKKRIKELTDKMKAMTKGSHE